MDLKIIYFVFKSLDSDEKWLFGHKNGLYGHKNEIKSCESTIKRNFLSFPIKFP